MRSRFIFALAVAAVAMLAAFATASPSKTIAQAPPPEAEGVVSIGRIQCAFDGAAANWRRTNLTYAVVGGESYSFDVHRAIDRAFLTWTNAGSGLTFTRVASNADIVVSLYDRLSYFGPGILGATDTFWTCPSFESGLQPGVEVWLGASIVGSVTNLTYIQNVATHEIGHAIGLGHSTAASGLMAPFATILTGQRVVCPSTLDIAALRSNSRSPVFSMPLSLYRELPAC